MTRVGPKTPIIITDPCWMSLIYVGFDKSVKREPTNGTVANTRV